MFHKSLWDADVTRTWAFGPKISRLHWWSDSDENKNNQTNNAEGIIRSFYGYEMLKLLHSNFKIRAQEQILYLWKGFHFKGHLN